MATRTISDAGGNWDSTGSWVDSTVPLAGDDVVATGTSGSLTVNVSTNTINSFDLTGYTATLTINSSLNVTGNVTLAGTIAGTTGTLIIWGTSSMTSNSKTLTCGLRVRGAFTRTLQDNWTVNGSSQIQAALNNNGTAKTLTCVGGFDGQDGPSGTAAIKLTGGTWSGNNNVANNLEFAGNVTVSGSVRYMTGTMTYTSGTITTTGSTVQVTACTLNTNGITWNTIKINGTGPSAQFTLNSLLSATTLDLPNMDAYFLGTAGFTVGTLTNSTTATADRTISLLQTRTYTVTTAITLAGNGANQWSIESSSGSLKVPFVFSGGTPPSLTLVKPTRLDSSGGTAIYTDDTITDCLNWSAPPSGGTVSAVYNVTP